RVAIGRDVGRIQGAERQYEGASAGKGDTVFCRVADGAVGRTRQVFATLDQACRLQFGGDTAGVLTVICRERHPRAARKCGRSRTRGHIGENRQRPHRDDRKSPQGGMRYTSPLNENIHGCTAVHGSPQAVSEWDMGNTRTRLPVAANTAFATAGPTGATPGSPTPVGGSVEATMYTSTLGISFMRSTR